MLLIFIFSSKLTKPLVKLSKAAKKLAQGEYNIHIDSEFSNEIGDLAFSFNRMVRDIKVFQEQLLKNERQKSEIAIAENIQTSLVPKAKSSKYYEITAKMVTADEVGGDYYDIISEDEDNIWLGMGDVSGHGLTSGLIMMMVQTAFNTILLNHPEISPSVLVNEVNKVIYQNIKERLGEDHFMTLSFLSASKDGIIEFAGAHLDFLIYRSESQEVERIQTEGVWLGIVKDTTNMNTNQSFKLDDGDTVVMYTDGLIEAMNQSGEQYDLDRLITVLKENGNESLSNLESSILIDVASFMDKQADDITMMLFRKKRG